MAMILDGVVPFGRSMDEYTKMFNLSEKNCNCTFLGVGDGPASFNAEMTKKGKEVISVDPIYQFSSEEIYQRFNDVVEGIIEQVKATPADWVWTYHQSPEDLKNNRIKAIDTFIADYDLGKKEGRYIIGELPKLDFPDGYFDLSLCSHFLFLYSDFYDYDFHLNSILEMLRVSQEVRIFPLLTLNLKPSPYVEKIIQYFTKLGYEVTKEKADYELQKGGDCLLKIKKRS